MKEFEAYIGLDVHKNTIAVAAARSGRCAAEYCCEIRNEGEVAARLLERVSCYGESLSFCYEAGPCGYVLQRELESLGHECVVVAPSLIPKRPGNRVKTDRRDALELARLHRAGELAARNRLSGFLLRHGLTYREGKCRWTARHFDWLEALEFETAVRRTVLLGYLDAVRDAGRRVDEAGNSLLAGLVGWSRKPLVEALVALRGVDILTAATLVAELGDIARFDSPRQLMAFVGLVPSEHSSGGRRRPGSITRTGNGHARRVLVEAAWSYRFPARQTAHLRRKARGAPEAAQKRLCPRYLHLLRAGKPTQMACAAIARELLGFIWAIAREVEGLPHNMRAAA